MCTIRKRDLVGPMRSIGRSNLIILMCITKRVGKESGSCKPKLYYRENKFYRLNVFYNKRRSYTL